MKNTLRRSLGLVVSLGAVFGAIPAVSFAAAHSVGTNINDNGTISMIRSAGDGSVCKASYTSAGAFLSYKFNNWSSVVNASSEDTELPACNPSFITPAPGTIIFSDRGGDKGTGYFIAIDASGNVVKRGFTSEQVFKGLGYSFDKGSPADISWMPNGDLINDASLPHPNGSLVNKDGTIYFVSPEGLLGIPDLTTFNSWGMDFKNAVNANTNDRTKTQTGVLGSRSLGMLVPSSSSTAAPTTPNTSNNNLPSNAPATDEKALARQIIEAYPALPTNTVSSPDDVNAILVINSKVGADASLTDIYPYLSSNSIDFLNRVPTAKSLFEGEGPTMYDPDYGTNPTIIIFEGKQKAMLTDTVSQSQTGYSTKSDVIFVKENGSWKVDLVGTVKRIADIQKSENPNNGFVTGSGTTDISVDGLEYEQDKVVINDYSTRFLVKFVNNGNTTIHQYLVDLRINNEVVYSDIISYKLAPGEEIIIAFPLKSFWSSSARFPGNYRTQVAVGFDPVSLDVDVDDNYYYVDTTFNR